MFPMPIDISAEFSLASDPSSRSLAGYLHPKYFSLKDLILEVSSELSFIQPITLEFLHMAPQVSLPPPLPLGQVRVHRNINV